jgi:hypothetical protein
VRFLFFTCLIALGGDFSLRGLLPKGKQKRYDGFSASPLSVTFGVARHRSIGWCFLARPDGNHRHDSCNADNFSDLHSVFLPSSNSCSTDSPRIAVYY